VGLCFKFIHECNLDLFCYRNTNLIAAFMIVLHSDDETRKYTIFTGSYDDHGSSPVQIFD